jgi:hypothetical protein
MAVYDDHLVVGTAEVLTPEWTGEIDGRRFSMILYPRRDEHGVWGYSPADGNNVAPWAAGAPLNREERDRVRGGVLDAVREWEAAGRPLTPWDTAAANAFIREHPLGMDDRMRGKAGRLADVYRFSDPRRQQALARALSDRQALAVQGLYGVLRSDRVVAHVVGVSPQRANQVRHKATHVRRDPERLRAALSEGLRPEIAGLVALLAASAEAEAGAGESAG